MKRADFSQVRNYHGSNMPTMKGSLRRALWKLLFSVDFALGLSDREDDQGNVAPKLNQPGILGKFYRSVYHRIFSELERRHSAYDFSEPFPLPEVSATDFPKEEFRRWRKRVNHPIVIRGLVADSRACKEWSIDWLVSRFGDRPVDCVNLEDLQVSLGQNIKPETRTLKDFLLDDANEGYYINNFHGIFADDDVATFCNGQEVDALRGSESLVTQWFISRTLRSKSTFHCANGHNLFMNLRGQKEWLFVHPSYNPVMLPGISRYAIYAVSEFDSYALLDLEQMYAKHPILRHVPKYRVLLEEGDVLYNPPWWWHRVQNRTNLTIGCATRYLPDRYPGSFFPLQVIDLVKHPRRSALANIIMIRCSKANRSRLMENIFSKSRKAPEQRGET